MTREEIDRLAAEHVLGLLEGDDIARVETLVAANDPAFMTAAAAWRDYLAALDATAPELTPRDDVWAGIERDLGAAPAAQPAVRPRTAARRPGMAAALWDSLAFWRWTGLAAAAAALVLAVGLGVVARQAARTPVMVAVLLTETGSRPAAIVNTFADGRAELVPLESIAVPPGRALEIWTLWDRARGPVSIGLIDQARTVRLDLRSLPRAQPNQLFEITLEPATGSPTGRPTGPVLMKGTTNTAL